jgi:hypothetical protein
MKKWLTVVACVFLTGGLQASYGMIAVFWKATEGFYKSDGVTPLLAGPGPQYALTQLIFTPDPVPDPVDPFAPNYVSGNDVFLASYITDPSGDIYGSFDAGTPYTGAYVVGYLFLRVFDQGSHLGVTNGMWYFDSPLTNTIDNTMDPYLPDELNFSLMTDEFGDTLNKQVVVIPEPATWAFMLLGATTLVGRKLRRK